jgi:type II secretory pathway pseudopilin PulG
MRTSMRNERRGSGEAGFTLVEIVVAMTVLLIGLIGVAAAITYALAANNMSRNVTTGKLMITSMLEQVETLRNTQQLTFGQIANIGQVDSTGATRPFAGFPNDFRPVSTNPGPDGIFGTADDPTDQANVIPNYFRRIVINQLSPNLKRIQVTLRFPGNNGQIQELTGISYLNNDARSNYRR